MQCGSLSWNRGRERSETQNPEKMKDSLEDGGRRRRFRQRHLVTQGVNVRATGPREGHVGRLGTVFATSR